MGWLLRGRADEGRKGKKKHAKEMALYLDLTRPSHDYLSYMRQTKE
jgi:hypothetical protein